MNKTTNYELNKPEDSDGINVSVLNENFDKIDTALVGKVDKADGMGLSQNSFTNDERTKLANLENYDDTQIKNLLAEIVDSGAKNLLKNSLQSGTASHGVTATVAGAGQITLSGTADSEADSVFHIMTNTQLKAGAYRATGCPSGGATGTYRMDVVVNDSTVYRDEGNGVSFTLSDTSNVRVQIVIYRGNDAPTVPYAPMICTADDYAISPDFQPYRPSYQELYEMIKALQQ